MLRILHTGDLHLDAPLHALSPRAAALLRERQMAALEALLQKAVLWGADLVLIAGDCFDGSTPTEDTLHRFFGILSRCALPVVISPGNHDPYVSGGIYDALPLNVYVFREASTAFFEFPTLKTRVYGYAFTGDTHPSPRLPEQAELSGEYTNILVAHADITAPTSPYAPIGASQLAASGLTFAALGHIHKPMPTRRFGDTVAAYCGFFAGRGFDELGAGHANFVEIDGNRVRITPCETEADRFFIHTLDCTGAADGERIRLAADKALCQAAYPAGSVVRLRLVGEVGAKCIPNMTALQCLGEGFALFEVRDDTLPLYDTAYLLQDPGLCGAFYRALLPRLQSGLEAERRIAAKALRLGMAALAGREVRYEAD